MILGATYGSAGKVYRLRARTAPDGYGDPVLSWTDPLRTELYRGEVQSLASSSGTATETEKPTADQLQNERNLFVPGRVDLTATDRVEVESEVWRIEGIPIVRAGLATSIYTLARLRRHSNS